MSIEKIASIKAKRLATKRKTIKPDNEDASLGASGLAGSSGVYEFDMDVTKDILGRERQWRNRTTVLQSSGKVFAKNIFTILQSVRAREEGKLRPGQHPSVPPPGLRPAVPTGPTMGLSQTQQGPVYSRYDQERFRGKEGIQLRTKTIVSYLNYSSINNYFLRNGGLQDRHDGHVPRHDAQVGDGR